MEAFTRKLSKGKSDLAGKAEIYLIKKKKGSKIFPIKCVLLRNSKSKSKR